MKKVLAFFAFILIAMSSLAVMGCSDGEIAAISADFSVDQYFVGEQIDLTDASITVSYTGSKSDTKVAITNEMISGFDTTSTGEKNFTITYTEGGVTKEDTYTITVYNVASLSLLSKPYKENYTSSETQLDLAGIRVQAVAQNNQCVKDIRVTPNLISGYNPSLVNPDNPSMEQTVVITLDGRTCSFKITVELDSIGVFDSLAEELNQVNLENIEEADANKALDALKTYLILKNDADVYFNTHGTHNLELPYFSVTTAQLTTLTTIAFTYNYDLFKEYSAKIDPLFKETVSDTSRSYSLVDNSYDVVKSFPENYEMVSKAFKNNALTVFSDSDIARIRIVSEDKLVSNMLPQIREWFNYRTEDYSLHNTVLKPAIELHEKLLVVPADWTDTSLYTSAIASASNRIIELNTASASVLKSALQFVNLWRDDYFEIIYTELNRITDVMTISELANIHAPVPVQEIREIFYNAYLTYVSTNPGTSLTDYTSAYMLLFRGVEMVTELQDSDDSVSFYVFNYVYMSEYGLTFYEYTQELHNEIMRTLGKYALDEEFYDFVNRHAILQYNLLYTDKYDVTIGDDGVIVYPNDFIEEAIELFDDLLGLDDDRLTAFIRLIDVTWIFYDFGYSPLSSGIEGRNNFVLSTVGAFTQLHNSEDDQAIFASFLILLDQYAMYINDGTTIDAFRLAFDMLDELLPDFYDEGTEHWLTSTDNFKNKIARFKAVYDDPAVLDKDEATLLLEEFVLVVDYFAMADNYVYTAFENNADTQASSIAYGLLLSAIARLDNIVDRIYATGDEDLIAKFQNEAPLCLYGNGEVNEDTGDKNGYAYWELHDLAISTWESAYVQLPFEDTPQDVLDYYSSIFDAMAGYFFEQWLGTMVTYNYYELTTEFLTTMVDFGSLSQESIAFIYANACGNGNVTYGMINSLSFTFLNSFQYSLDGVGDAEGNVPTAIYNIMMDATLCFFYYFGYEAGEDTVDRYNASLQSLVSRMNTTLSNSERKTINDCQPLVDYINFFINIGQLDPIVVE